MRQAQTEEQSAKEMAYLFQYIKVIKDKEKPRDSSRLKEITNTRQLN